MNVLSWAVSVLGSPGVPGAIDIVVVRHDSGHLESSPFHVKMFSQTLSKLKDSSGGVVRLRINGNLTPVVMRLGRFGEAFFIEPTSHAARPLFDISSVASGDHFSDYGVDAKIGTNGRIRSFSLGSMPLQVASASLQSSSTIASAGLGGLQRDRSKSDLSVMVQQNDMGGATGEGATESSEAEDLSWKWGKMPKSMHSLPFPERDLGHSLGPTAVTANDSEIETLTSNPQSSPLEESKLVPICVSEIPFDAISPEPPTGDFYDSDTDSYLSLEEGDGDNLHRYKYRKTLVPPQDSLRMLDLRDGENDIQFEMEGCPSVSARIFVWSERSRIVVIDIEGGIATTKSSSGGLFGMFSGSTTTVVHDGVARLLRQLSANGYQLLYVGSKGFGDHCSRAQLARVNGLLQAEGSHGPLPSGPVFCSPESLLERGGDRPDLFKASALRGLKSLFPPAHSPYSAAFCTRIHDTVIFSRYGLTEGRTFVVDPSGEVSSVNRTFKRTFAELCDTVDFMFPPLSNESLQSSSASHGAAGTSFSCCTSDEGYNDFAFWRPPPPII